jgi:hypothetical protein
MSDETAGIVVGAGVLLLYTVLVLGGLAGYVMNVVDLIREINGPIGALVVVRVIGLFLFPLGAILGWVA